VDATRLEHGGKMQEKETLDEKLPGLFEPDTLLPIQYFEAMRRKHLLEGEKRLILSVLEDAVECFMKCIESPTSKGQRLFRDADEWINLEDKHWVFSFDNVCDMLDINPEYMRRGLKQWKERKVEAMQRAAIARAEAEALAAQAPAIEEPANAVELETPAPIAQPIAAAQPAVAARINNKIFNHGNRAKAATPPMQTARRPTRSLRKLHA
jgi:hypothetical protein